LQELSERGIDRWALLFDPSQGQGASVVGKWLRENPPPDGSKIQVSIAGAASTFTFPWSLIYDGPGRGNCPPSEQGFWGIRYVIEQRPLAVAISPGRTVSEQPKLIGRYIEIRPDGNNTVPTEPLEKGADTFSNGKG
jgi:hypothetical protein